MKIINVMKPEWRNKNNLNLEEVEKRMNKMKEGEWICTQCGEVFTGEIEYCHQDESNSLCKECYTEMAIYQLEVEEKREKVMEWLKEAGVDEFKPYGIDGPHKITYEDKCFWKRFPYKDFLTEDEAEELYEDYLGEHGDAEYHDKDGVKK